MKSNFTKTSTPDASNNPTSGQRKPSTNNSFRSMFGTLIMMLLFTMMSQISFGQYSIAPGQTYSQNFDSLPTVGNWSTPAFWRIAGDGGVPNEGSPDSHGNPSGGYVDIPYSGANNGGTAYVPAYGSAACPSGGSMGWNCYRDSAHQLNRCIGNRATPSTNQNFSWYVAFTNTGSIYISSLTVSYEILKFMKSQSCQQAIQLFYSLDDNTYYKADSAQFTTITANDGSNTCYTTHAANPNDPGVGAIVNVTGTFFPNTAIAPGATFYLAWNYSVLAINTTSKESLLGLDSVFVTAHSNPPSMCCPTVSGITNTSATLGAKVVSINDVTLGSRGVVYSTSTPVTISNNQTPEGGISDGVYTQSINSLAPQTKYYYAGYAHNAIGDSVGPQSNFYTLSNPPTSAASAFAANTVSGSEIDLSWNPATFPGSGASNTGYLILVRSDLTNPTTTGIVNATAPNSLSLPSGTTLLATIISGATLAYANTGLTGLSQFNYTIVPFTWDGTNAATYNYFITGAPSANATTTNGTPTLASPTVSSVTNTTATLGATVVSNGGFNLTDRGTVWNTTSSVTISTNPLSDGGLTVAPFTSNRIGLSAQAQYFYAGYATNSAGSTLSPISSFYSLSNPATAQATNMTTVPVAATTNDTVKWTAATFPASGATVKGYVLLIAQNPNTPSLGSSNGQAPSAGANTTIVSSTIASNAVSYFDNNGKSGLTRYNYKLIPFTWDGTHAATYNYLTSGALTATVRTNAGNLYTQSIGTWDFSTPLWSATSAGPFNLNWVDSNFVVFTGNNFDSLSVGANVKVQGISFLENAGSEYRLCGPDTITMLGTTPTITLNGTVTANGVLDAAVKTSSPININFTGTAGAAIFDFDKPFQPFTGGIIIQNGIGRVNINATNAAGTGPIICNANGIRFTNHNGNNFPNDVKYPYDDNAGRDTIVIPNNIILDSIGVHPFQLCMGGTNNPNLAFIDWRGIISNSGTFTTADTVFLGNAVGILSGGGAGHAQFSNHCTYGGITCNNSSVSALFTNGVDDAFSPNADYVFAPSSGAWDLNGYNQRLRSLSGPGSGISNSQAMLSTLTIQGSANKTYSGSLTGNIGITLNSLNTGTLTMAGFCSQTGNTVVSGGTLVLKTTPRNTLFFQSNLTVNGGTLKDSTQQEIANVNLSSGTLLIASGDTLYVDSVFDFTGGTLTVNGVLQINPSGTLKCHNNTVTGSGKFILSSGATLEMANTAGITSSGATGNIQVSGTRFFSNGGKYIYDAASAQVTGNGLPATVGGLTISNASGITITNSVTVNGTLAFIAGTVTTGANSVTIGSAGSVTGAGFSSFVNGNEIKNLATGTHAINFEIGNGSNYTPVNLNFNGTGITSASGGLLAFSINGDHPQIGTSMITSLKSVNRYWTLTPTNLTFNTTFNATFNFVNSDIDGGANTSNFIVSEYSGSSWTQPTVGTRTGLSTQATGISAFSDFIVGEACAMPTITPNITNVTCVSGNNGSINPTVTGGTSPFFYLWSNGATSFSISSLTAGNYTLTVTGNGSCTGTFSYSVTQPSLVVPIITGGNAFCAGGSLYLATGSYSGYSWSNGSSTQTTNLTSAGTYSVTVTNASGCTGTASQVITVNPLPTPTITGGSSFCTGGSLTLSTGSYNAYNWSNSATTQSTTVNSGGTYSVSVTDGNGCVVTTSQAVTVNPLPTPTITPSGPTTFCISGSVNLDAGSYISYAWNNAATTESITVSTTGNYTVTVTNSNGCTGASSATSVTVSNPIASATASTPIPCAGAHGIITVSVSGGIPTYTGTGNNTVTAGTYTYTVTDSHGCSSSTTITVSDPTTPLSFTTIVSNVSGCGAPNNGFIAVTATGGNGTKVYSKDNGVTYQTSSNLSGLTVGTYNIKVKITNECVSNATAIAIATNAPLTFTTTVVNASTCNSATGKITVNASGGAGYYNYSKNGGTTYQAGSLFANLMPGSYSIKIKDVIGCMTGVTVVSVGPVCREYNSVSTTADHSNSFQVYPNPASDKVVVSFTSDKEESYTIHLVDITGRVVLQSAATTVIGENQYQIDLTSVAKGVYMFILQTAEGTLQQKILVQ